jgi:hypothetical protein
MKYCPTCNTRYDEEILRFCMKDGTPLVEEEEPAFIELPSESLEEPEDEPGEVTVIRNHTAPPQQPPQNLIDEISFAPDPQPSRERIVVPTEEQPQMRPQARVIPPYQPPTSGQPNTAKVVVLTVIGTVAAMALGAFGFWALQNERSADNLNINTNFNGFLDNQNANVNTNLGAIDSNFNFNGGSNFNTSTNVNMDSNANLRTPSPSPTLRPSPSPTATLGPPPTPDDLDEPTPRPSPARTPGATPTPLVIRPGSTPPRMAPLPTNRPANN